MEYQKSENRSRNYQSVNQLAHSGKGRGISMVLPYATDGISDIVTVQRKENRTGLPDNLKAGVESLSGFPMDDVQVHYNSRKPAELQSLAYTQGTEIHIGPGQEKHLPHELWHVAQQKGGRVTPTMEIHGKRINDNQGLEREADRMGKKAFQMKAGSGSRDLLSTDNCFQEPNLLNAINPLQFVKPDSDQNNTFEIKTDDHIYIINGNPTKNCNANFNAPGTYRYVRTNSVGECITIAFQGTRTDGTVVSLFAHLSSHQYLQPRFGGNMNDQSIDYSALKPFEDMNNVQSIAVTNFSHNYNIKDRTKPLVKQYGDLYNNAGKPAYVDFIFDSENFDIHSRGIEKKDSTEIGPSVTTMNTEKERCQKFQNLTVKNKVKKSKCTAM